MNARIESVQPVLMARDVAASIEFYAKLGFQAVFRDTPADTKYAGVKRDRVELHLQWHDAADWAPTQDRPTYRFVVPDVDALFAEYEERGVLAKGASIRDTPWGTREFHVQDPDRNGLQFYRDL